MTQQQAEELARNHKGSLVVVQSDGVIYVDPDYAAIKKQAESLSLKLFVTTGNIPTKK